MGNNSSRIQSQLDSEDPNNEEIYEKIQGDYELNYKYNCYGVNEKVHSLIKVKTIRGPFKIGDRVYCKSSKKFGIVKKHVFDDRVVLHIMYQITKDGVHFVKVVPKER